MAKVYRIQFVVDDAQARAAAQRSVKGMDSIDAAAKRAAANQAREAAKLDSLQDRLVKRDYSRRVQYEKMKVEESAKIAERAAAKQKQALDRQTAMLSAGALAGIKVLMDGYNQIRDNAMEAALATLEMKKALRVEGTLKGLTSEEALKESLAFRAKTGLDKEAGTAFVQGFKGSSPAGETKGNITPQVSQELMEQAGIMAARQGGDANTRGELAGILSQFGKVNTAEEGLGQLEAIRDVLEAGRGSDSELTRQLLQVAGAIVAEGGVVKSLGELGALISVSSLSAGEGMAGTRAEQLIRGLRVGLTKRHTKEGTDVSQADYLASLGISEDDTLETTMEKISPDLAQAEAQGRDLSVYLSSKNFNSEEERRAIIETFRNRGVLKARTKEVREGGGKGADVIKANKAFLMSNEGRAALGGVSKDIQTVTQGAPGQSLAALTSLAESSPALTEADKDPLTQAADFYRGLMNFNISDPRAEGRRTRVSGEIARNLRSKAEGLGISPRELDAIDPTMPMGPKGPLAMQEFVTKVEAMIKERGGDLSVDLKPTLDKMNAALDALNTKLAVPARAPGPLPGAPVGGPVRPGQ